MAVKEVFYIDGVTSMVKANWTVRACIKASDRSTVSTANLTITEIANSNGGYEVAHPDYTEDLLLFLALTSDTTKYAALRLSAATGIVPASSTAVAAIPTTPLLTGDSRLNHLDADISTRSTFAGGAVASVSGSVGSVAGSVNSVVAGVTLTPGEHTAIVADTQTGMTAQGYTTTRAGYLDTLNGLVTAIWAAATRTLSTFGFTVAVDTAQIAASVASAIGSAAGIGSVPTTIIVKVNNIPVDNVAIYVTTDIYGLALYAGTLYTDDFGKATFMLDRGDYYVWKQSGGYNFTNPEKITVV